MKVVKVVSVQRNETGEKRYRSYLHEHENSKEYIIGVETKATPELLELGMGIFTFKSIKHARSFDGTIDGDTLEILEGIGDPVQKPLDFCLDPFGINVSAASLRQQIEYRDRYQVLNRIVTMKLISGTVMLESFTPIRVIPSQRILS